MEKKNGLYKEYYSGNKIKEECNYKDGKKDGLYKRYRDNSLDGKIEEECNYKDGIVVNKNNMDLCGLEKYIII